MKTILSAPMLLFTGVCALSAWFVVQIVFGFGLVFPFTEQPFIHWTQWWVIPAAGVLMGVLGAFYNLVLLRLTLWADNSSLMPRALRALLPFMVAGALLYLCPQVLVGFGISTLQLEQLPLPLLGLFGLLAVKMAFSWISFASGVSGGLLMPVLLMGSIGGACMASGLLAADVISAEQTATVLTLGMTGLFAGSVRAPLTGAFLLLEMTGSFHNMPAVVLTAYIAAFTANALHSEPVYDSLRARCIALAGATATTDNKGNDPGASASAEQLQK
jgi:H+/Cl- antiporter ClcA